MNVKERSQGTRVRKEAVSRWFPVEHAGKCRVDGNRCHYNSDVPWWNSVCLPLKPSNIDEASAYILLVIGCAASTTYYLRLDVSPTVYRYGGTCIARQWRGLAASLQPPRHLAFCRVLRRQLLVQTT